MNEVIRHPCDIIPLIQKFALKRQEHFGIIAIDSEHKVLLNKVLFIGTEHNSLVDTKMIFWELCKKKASAFVVFHNHPSQNTNPSKEDVILTNALNEASSIIGIQLLDHIIIGKYDYYSFLENENVIEVKKEKRVAEGV